MGEILPYGVYCPTFAFFLDDPKQTLDLKTISKHVVRLARAGLVGVVLQGSTGEAVHLTREERKLIIRSCREALNAAGFQNFKLVAGAGGFSLLESLDLLQDAHESGADAAIVLTPGYFPDQMTPEALIDFYTTLANATPLPFLAYNFPGVCNGVNMSIDTLLTLAKHPKIIGCKLSCNDLGKMTYLSEYSGNLPKGYGEFKIFTGSSDFLIAAYGAGVAGTITAMGNQFPHTVVALWNAIVSNDLARARELQAIVTRAEAVVNEGFIPTARAALRATSGYGGKSRLPIRDVPDSYVERDMQEIWALEKKLSQPSAKL